MDMKNNDNPEAVLREWRTKILNGFLAIVAVAAAVGAVVSILDAISHPNQWPVAILFAVLELALIVLAVFRKIDYRVRAWGVLLVPYVVGVSNLASFGLGSSGRLFLLAAPIGALILIGVRSGITMSVLAALTMVIFTFLAKFGLLQQWLVTDRNSLLLSDWFSESTDTWIMVLAIMSLLILFYRFQESLIRKTRRAQAEVLNAQALLEQQNATLEQKIQERAGELQASNLILERRNAELALLNSVGEAMVKTLDVKAMTRLIGDKMREIFDADSVLIMLLDRQTNLIHVPYEYDENEGGYIDYVEPFPLGTGLSSKVITSGKPLMLGTLEEEIANGAYFPPEIIEKGSGFFSQSWLGVPIMAKEQVLGLVALADAHPHAFDENHLSLLRTLSSNMGVAIENARLFAEARWLLQETKQRNAELAIINSVQAGLASKLDAQAIYELIGENVKEVFDVQVVDIVIYDPAFNLISMPYSYERGDRSVISPREPFGFRLQVINTREPLLINQNFVELASQHNNPLLTGAWPKSALFVPLLVDEQVKGIISIQDLERENAFSESDVRLLETLANSMSVALENARLFDETQRLLKETEQRNRELAIINKIQQGLVSKLDLQSMIDLIGDELMRIFPPEERKAHNYSVYVALYDPQTNIIQFPYLIDGAGDRFVEPPTELGPGLTSAVIRSGQTLLLNNLDEQISHGVILFTKSKVHINSQSWLGVPIRSGDRVIGVLSLQDRRPNLFTESDVRILSTLAFSLGVALENARLFSETQQRAAELATVNAVSSALVGELDLSVLLNLVGEQVRSVFKADIAYVALLDKENNIINFPYQYGEQHEPLQFGQGLSSKIIHSSQPLLINQGLEQQRQKMGVTLVGKQARSYLGVPIFLSGETIGVISVQNTTQEDAFTENDQHLLSTIAANVGIALQNARLFDEVKRQEQFSKETQRRLADIIDFLPDATLVIDHEGKVMAWNHAMEEMTGILASEMLGKGDHEYALPFYGERRPILIDLVLLPQEEFEKKVYVQIKRTGEALTGETYTPALKGGSKYLFGMAAPLRDVNGNIVGAIETIRDITERKQAEEELRKAKADAEQANYAKSAFLANMSHELRTPLNAIIGFTRIVRRKSEGVLPEKQTENLDKVLVSAENLLSLINTVLDIAKIEAGRLDVLAANFRISPLIDLCANTAQPLLRPTVMLEKQVDENLTTVYSDQDKIRQIILNLLSNAAKFTHAGKITLSARQDGENLHISIADTGIGISAEALPNIFKEFEQADPSTTRKYGGTGLGLTISRNLAHLLGGDLTAKSELGQGSMFTLVIPMKYQRGPSQTLDTPPPLPSHHRPAPAPETAQHPAPGSAKKRILVIDDDPDAVYLLQESLDQGQFEISGSRNGLDGLRMAREQQPQAILLDVLMPGVDGWQVLHDLKNDPATANIPVILLTIVDKKALGYQLGAADYLLKPLDPVAVREALDRAIIQDGRRPKRVLVVDDDPNVVDMLRQSLPESDFSLESALDGVAGLRAIEANRPDILLLDLIMPRLDGFGVIENLRANPQARDLPIIVISAKELTSDESKKLKESVAFVMKKQGFDGEKLIDEINNVLRRDA